MQIFNTLTDKVIPLAIDNVDTDMIIPAQYMTKISREGYGENLFQRLRDQDKDFVFNNEVYNGAKILLAADNFGCGSSREHAVWALLQAGIKVVIAKSFSDIFYNNAGKNGLLLVSLDGEVIDEMLEESRKNIVCLTVNLSTQTVINASNESFHFDYDPFRKECLLKGQDDLAYLLEATNNA